MILKREEDEFEQRQLVDRASKPEQLPQLPDAPRQACFDAFDNSLRELSLIRRLDTATIVIKYACTLALLEVPIAVRPRKGSPTYVLLDECARLAQLYSPFTVMAWLEVYRWQLARQLSDTGGAAGGAK